MQLTAFFLALSDVLEANVLIESRGRELLVIHANDARLNEFGSPLSQSIKDILLRPDANPICKQIAEIPFSWSPPTTSTDPKYIKDSLPKVHVELLGPDGLVKTNEIRLGLYGMLPGYEYGIRTHLAEEIFIMLAGQADWKRGDGNYETLNVGEKSYHPSMMPHANKTTDQPFMSVYIWDGDVSKDSYAYQGT